MDTFSVTSSGMSQTISQGKGFFNNYFLCARKVVLAVGVQHSCPGCPPPGCCSMQKLDARPVAWRQWCASRGRSFNGQEAEPYFLVLS